MFGKTHESDTMNAAGDHGFFGDEAAAAEAVEVHDLRDRVEQVEAQVNSQFTSLATYAQIAQEQVELARSEARTATERSEQRLTSLVERERADRIASYTGSAPAGTAPEFSARLDAIEQSVAQIRRGLDECMSRQKALADAITAMFERQAAPVPASSPSGATVDDTIGHDPMNSTDETAAHGETDDDETIADDRPDMPAPTAALPGPSVSSFAPPSAAIPIGGPIADLSLEG